MLRARWLTSRSQANWMSAAGIVIDIRIVSPNAFQLRSTQCPEGYEICRVEGTILNPEGEWERQYCTPRFSKGDPGWEGYFNEWEWICEVEEEPLRRHLDIEKRPGI